MSFMKANQKNIARIFSVLVLTLVMVLVITPPAYAVEVIEGGPDAAVEADEVIDDDLLIAGEDVRIDGVVNGDVFAAGQSVDVSGEVHGNLFVGAQTITISGTIDGTLFMGGYAITMEDGAYVGQNVYFGGFSFTAQPESLLDRSVYGAAYQLLLDGEVTRDVTTSVAALQIAGPVGGDVNAEVGETQDGGMPDSFEYWMPGMPSIEIIDPGYTIDEEMVQGTVHVDVTPIETNVDVPEVEINPGWLVMQRVRQRAGEFVALLLVGALALGLFKTLTLNAVEEIKTNAGTDTLWGLVVYAVYVPVVITLFLGGGLGYDYLQSAHPWQPDRRDDRSQHLDFHRLYHCLQHACRIVHQSSDRLPGWPLVVGEND